MQPATTEPSSNAFRPLEWLSAALLLGLLAVCVPMMLCMPLTADPVLYDLQAETVVNGGVLYRDIVEPNLPGIVWLHLLIRSLFGWSQLALKAVDLVIIAGIVTLLVRWPIVDREQNFAGETSSRVGSLLLATLLFWFYFGTSEWCHCQRDPWMLLPALIALYFRKYQIQRVGDTTVSHGQVFGFGFAEGLIWACGFWIKPFIAVPALAAIVLGAVWNRELWKRTAIDLSGVLAGGLLIGGLGTFWLVQSGTWPHFWEMAIEWNPTYFEVGRERWTWDRLWREQLRFYPFSLCHLFAIPCSLYLVAKSLGWKLNETTGSQRAGALLSAVYLGWLLQTFTLQHLFDYIHVPEVLLAIAITVRQFPRLLKHLLKETEAASFQPIAVLAAGLFVTTAMVTNPAVRWDRVRVWAACVTQGDTPAVKTALQHFPLPDWNELQPALEFLEQQNLRDGELTVHNVYLVHAYHELGLRPSTRFVYLDVLSRVFRERDAEIVDALDQSGHRYVLSSLLENGMSVAESRDEADSEQPALPPNFPTEHLDEFPYNQELVFRNGQYVVHRVQQSAAPLNPQFAPLASRSGNAR